MMTLSRPKIMFTALVTVAVAAVVAGTIVAQERASLKDSLESQDGDATIVATADGKDVTRGDVRRAVAFMKEMDSSLTSEVATSQIIVQVIDRAIVAAEIDRREITVSDAEANAYVSRNRYLCRSDNGAQCRAAVSELGFDTSDDAYWSDVALPEYKRMIAETKLFQAIIDEKGLGGADNETLFAAREALAGKLRVDAEIVWHDEDLKETYQEALESM